MKNLGQFEISRFDTAITDDNHPGGTALIAESAAQDSKMTLIMPSMIVSQIVTCLLASAQESRYDNMSLIDVEAEYRKATQPAAMPEILRIKIDYEKKMLILDAGSGLLHFRLSEAVLHEKGLCVWDMASTSTTPTTLSPKESSSS